jgi:hypothetical protein
MLTQPDTLPVPAHDSTAAGPPDAGGHHRRRYLVLGLCLLASALGPLLFVFLAGQPVLGAAGGCGGG